MSRPARHGGAGSGPGRARREGSAVEAGDDAAEPEGDPPSAEQREGDGGPDHLLDVCLWGESGTRQGRVMGGGDRTTGSLPR